MIQRTILRSSRALSSSLRPQPAVRTLNPSSSLTSRSAVAPARIAARWYSETPDAAAAKKDDAGEQTAGSGDAAAEAAKKELEAKNKEIVELKDKYLRSVADFRNLQERTKREVSAAKDFALSRFSRDLIDSVDNLDRALLTVPADLKDGGNKDLQNLHAGLTMTETILMGTLKKHGLERFDPSVEREKFDPNKHEAVFQTPQPEKEDGTVFHTQQKGFLLNGRVIRAAKVGVVKNS